jgi:hypothetical protein
MVKTAIFGNVNSCDAALSKVLASIREKGIERVVWLGDIVGCGPNPIKCVDTAKDLSEDLTEEHYLLEGDLDYYFSSGMFSPYVSAFVKASIEVGWRQLGINHPRDLFEVTQRLEEIQRSTKPPKPKGWLAWLKGLLPSRRDYMTAKEVKEIVRNLPAEDLPVVEKYAASLKKECVEEYLSFLRNLESELVFMEDRLVFAHSFPMSMIEHAEELGIDKRAVENKEVYVVPREEWEKRVKHSIEVYASVRAEEVIRQLKTRFIVAEDVAELLPEGHRLLVAQSHQYFDIGKVVNTGAVFNPRDPEDNKAHYLVHDSESGEITKVVVEYDREAVNKQMEEAGLAKFMR